MDKDILEQMQEEGRAETAEGAADSTLALNPLLGISPEELAATARTTATQAVKHPLILARIVLGFGRKLAAIAGGDKGYQPDAKDRRFQDSAWQENWFYRGLLQSYLAMESSVGEWVEAAEFDDLDEQRARFIMQLLTDSIAPTNMLLGNPAAMRRAFDTGGASLKTGLEHLVDDIRHNHGMPSQVDKSAFEVGVNLATTPGAVVFKNEMLELIQYQPTTSKVYERPLLVIAAPVNKAYIFDLTPEKSFNKFCVEQGMQVFAVSWRNPSPEQSHWGIDEYINALKEARVAIQKITHSEDMNVYSPCSGGIMSTIFAGHLQALGDTSIHSLSLPVTVLLNDEADSDITLFINDRTMEIAKKNSAKEGVLRGKQLSRVFSWMRPNDLIWNYVVNNYLMGNKPPAFDILYWNGDTTNLPAQFHHDLMDALVEGELTRAGGITVCDTAIDLSAIDIELYFVGGSTDHITPWKACYRNTKLFGNQGTFVLSTSGHIQCMVNPPGNMKTKFYTSADLPDSPDEWLAGAEAQAGTWWLHWMEWLQARSGSEKARPRQLGNRKYKVGDAAPGAYVFETPE